MKKFIYVLIGLVLGWIIMNIYQNLYEPYILPVIYEDFYSPDITEKESGCLSGGHPIDPIC